MLSIFLKDAHIYDSRRSAGQCLKIRRSSRIIIECLEIGDAFVNIRHSTIDIVNDGILNTYIYSFFLKKLKLYEFDM